MEGQSPYIYEEDDGGAHKQFWRYEAELVDARGMIRSRAPDLLWVALNTLQGAERDFEKIRAGTRRGSVGGAGSARISSVPRACGRTQTPSHLRFT